MTRLYHLVSAICLWAVKKISSAFLRMNSNSHKNHGEAVYIINSVGIAYHQCGALYIIIAKEDTACGWWYAPSVMRYTLKRDDIPLLSQWIKKFDKSKLVEFFGTGDRTWTCTVTHWNLNPTCLPIPPRPHIQFACRHRSRPHALLFYHGSGRLSTAQMGERKGFFAPTQQFLARFCVNFPWHCLRGQVQ